MRNLVAILGRDGILPIVVATTPLVVRLLFGRGHLAEVIAAILLPITLAIYRSHTGGKQLNETCHGRVHWGRQLTFAVAIILLLLFEMYVMILHFANDEPPSAWIVAVVIFVAYIATILIALRPMSSDNPDPSGFRNQYS
jgi:hypothetical protein